MKPYPKKPFLTVLLAFVLMAFTGCGAPQARNDAPDGMVQPVPPTALPQPSSEVQDTSADPDNCADNNSHPIAQSIATTYAVSYQQVMTWFCSGYSFENILIALETSEAVDVPAEALLEMLHEKEWEEIWADVGFSADP